MIRARRTALPVILICIGTGMIVLGILSGELTVILRKAIYICLECIGVG